MIVQPEGATPAIETSHPFTPRQQVVGTLGEPTRFYLQPNPYLCAGCSLAEAAHAETTTEGR